MDIIILGLLMIRRSTIYEMRKAIETNLTGISSSSVGSIQAAIKKLLEKKFISYEEYVENSVNKKVYRITSEGKAYFQANISQPMCYKEKSMELGKFFFMGFVEKSQRTELIDLYIAELKDKLGILEQIKAAAEASVDFDENTVTTLKQQGVTEEITVTEVREIAFFQRAMLDLSIDKIKFEIQWFEAFKQQLY